VKGALQRYRIMAFIVGTLLLILFCVCLPLTYAANEPLPGKILGPIHGALYIVYLLTCLDLARRARFNLLELAAMVCAGFVPGLAFVIEWWTARKVHARYPEEFESPVAPHAADVASAEDPAGRPE
jgi:integral membrane protein